MEGLAGRQLSITAARREGGHDALCAEAGNHRPEDSRGAGCCGRIHANHFDSITAHAADTELVGVADIDPAALERAVARTGAPGFPSLEALLAGSDPDLVILATPSGLHASQAIQVARAGKHVMTEKPMATRWQDGKAMVQACDEAGSTCSSSSKTPQSHAQLLKRAVEDGFGKICLVHRELFWNRPQFLLHSAHARHRGIDGGAS